MATRKTAESPVLISYEEHSQSDFDPDSERNYEQFVDSLHGAHSGYTLWVYRVPQDERGEAMLSARQTVLFTTSLDRYKLEEIIDICRKRYMRPGDSAMCIALKALKNGERGIRFNQIVQIEREQQAVRDDAPTRESLAEVLRAVQENTAHQVAAIRSAMTEVLQARQPAQDPMQVGIQMCAMFSQMMGTVFSRMPGSTPATGAPPSMLEMVKTLKELRSLVPDASGYSSDPDSLGNIIQAVAPLATALITARAAHPSLPTPQNPRLRRVIAAPASPGIAPPTVAPSINPEAARRAAMFVSMRPHLEQLHKAACEGADATIAARVILQQIPEGSPQEEMLLQFLEPEDWFDTVRTIYPPCADKAEWFKQLRDSVLAAFSDADDPTPPDTPPTP